MMRTTSSISAGCSPPVREVMRLSPLASMVGDFALRTLTSHVERQRSIAFGFGGRHRVSRTTNRTAGDYTRQQCDR